MNDDPLGKANAALRYRLACAAPDDEISAVVELTLPPSSRAAAPLGGTPAATALRRASRARAVAEIGEHTQVLVAELARKGLSPQSGHYLPLVLVRGPADRIREALALDGVVSAVLQPETSGESHFEEGTE